METAISLSKLQDDIYEALKAWREDSADANSLAYLRLFQQAKRDGDGNDRQASNKILLDALKILEARHKVEADLLRQRFLNGTAMHLLANRFNLSEATAYRKQKEAVSHLALILQTQERQTREEWQATLENRLEAPTYLQLIGFEEQLDALQEVLSAPKPPWLLSIEGLGGIGKTALADSLSRRIIQQGAFDDFGWVSAKQQDFLPGMGIAPTDRPALDADSLVDALLQQLDKSASLSQSPDKKQATLTALLKERPHLIVVDNLESIADLEALLPLLRKAVNPSKVLLTSRRSLRAEGDVFCFTLKELSEAETLRFIRTEAGVRGISLLADAPEDRLKGIYEVVGGNPLALKLVIGQTSILPLSQVLDNLKGARGKTIDELYTFIYWQAWHNLDPVSQQVLLVMPLVQAGTLAQLQAASQLDMAEVEAALHRLVSLSLVLMGGDLDTRRYSIHRLTETFLLKEALKWQPLS